MDVNVYGKNLKRVSLGKRKCVKKKKKFWEQQRHVVLRKICGHVAQTSSRKNRSEGDNAVLSLGGNEFYEATISLSDRQSAKNLQTPLPLWPDDALNASLLEWVTLQFHSC